MDHVTAKRYLYPDCCQSGPRSADIQQPSEILLFLTRFACDPNGPRRAGMEALRCPFLAVGDSIKGALRVVSWIAANLHYTIRNGRLNWLVSVIAFACSQLVIDGELDLGLTCPWPSTSTIGSF
ncbi:hypothetical protein [Bradyrhizobium elkanii]|uniref:hypothetical protein n=1 Tax=Bradyrhizobium elkanii TaxID=29448 RepID=UPI003838495C